MSWRILLAGVIVFAVAVTGWAMAVGAQEDSFRRKRAGLVRALLLVTILGFAGLAWHEIVTRTFAVEAGGLRGMIAKTIPNTTESENTPEGPRYQFWAFTLPIGCSILSIVVTAGIGTGILYEYGYRTSLLGLWSWAFAISGGLILRAGSNYIIAIDLFI
ncbi:MAG: hypothetical protein ACREQV_02045 [Candidatus Binatia bacterium]